MVGSSTPKVKQHLAELEDAGVFSRTEVGTIFSRRMVRDQQIREKRAQYGYLSAKHPSVPKKKSQEKDTLKDTFHPPFGGSPSSPSSSSSSLKEKHLGGCSSLNGMTRSFEIFWKAFPKKRNKGQAERAWGKLSPDDVLLGVMLSKLDQAKRTPEWSQNNGKFIPHPGTWLNARGWEDEFNLQHTKERIPL